MPTPVADSPSSTLLAIPGVQPAIATLLGQVAQFQRLPARVQTAQRNAQRIAAAASAQGAVAVAAELAWVQSTLEQVADAYPAASATLATIVDGLRMYGLAQGQVSPSDLALQAFELAGQMGDLFATLEAAEDTLLTAARQVLPPDQVAAIAAGTPARSVVGLVRRAVPVVLIGGGLLLGWWAVSRGGGRTRAW